MRATWKAKLQAEWMREFERIVTELAPQHLGRIDWDTARHLYTLRKTAEDAAKGYVANHPQPGA